MSAILRIPDAPGLVWKKRKKGIEARWQARTDIIDRGYPIKSHRLWIGDPPPSPQEREVIATHCRRLQAEMLEWARGEVIDRPKFYYGQIYFAQEGDAVKIGFSQNVHRRLLNIKSARGAALTLLKSYAGTTGDEQRVHDRFRHLRIEGEWYRPAPELLSFIESVG